jgi:hypothetical protein
LEALINGHLPIHSDDDDDDDGDDESETVNA